MEQGHGSEARTRRTRRGSVEVRDLILKSAREEFQKSGFTGATTAAIARGADVTEAQIFRIFRSKVDLFQKAVFEPLNESFAAFNQAQFRARAETDRGHASRPTERRSETRAYIAQLMAFIEQNRDMLVPLLAAQLFNRDDIEGVGAVGGLKTYFDLGAEQLASNSDGLSPPKADFLVRASFAAVLASVLFKDWLFEPCHMKANQMSALLTDFTLDGIGARQNPAG